MPAPTREVLLELLSAARIKGPQLDETVARALDPDYWRGLVPDFRVESATSSLEPAPVDDAAIAEAIQAQRQHGYFRLPGLIAQQDVRRLNAAIDAVAGAGWPPTFVFVYDEAWQSARTAGARRLLEAGLGPDARQLFHVWAHVVKPVAGSSGWSPHLDGDPGRRMTIWVALSPATLENGCIHVVPRDAASADLVQRFGAPESRFDRAEVSSLLHATHALVASPGDALGWGFDVLHWGGHVRETGPERRAFSFEYVAAGEPPLETDGPSGSLDVLPSFVERVRTVAAGVIAYQKFEPILDRFADVAHGIKKRLDPAV